MVLKFVFLGGERKNIVYWNMKVSKNKCIDIFLLFDLDEEFVYSDGSDLDLDFGIERNYILVIEDEFFLVFMKFCLGFMNLDLVIRFRVLEVIVFNIFIMWFNFLYICFGVFKVWFYRRVILDNMFKKFKEEYFNNIIIIDCIELKI